MDDRPATPTASAYAANLQQTLKELRKKVQECEGQLTELRSKQHPIPQTPAGQISTLVAAFNDVTNSEPWLPYPGSVLPALLALRDTHRTIGESKTFLTSQARATEAERRRLDTENATVRDHKLLGQALAERIGNLQTGEAEANADTVADADADADGDAVAAADAAKGRAEEMEDKKKHYKRETSRLMKALNQFINEHLAAMLAAEELGGPVVGDLMDVDPDDLAAGFNAQGKRKKTRNTKTVNTNVDTNINDDAGDEDDGDDHHPRDEKRQRRIDEIWGRSDNAHGKHDEQEKGSQKTQTAGQKQKQKQTNEVKAAAAEMRRLTEDLLNRLVDSRGNSSDSYVQLQRESAAARFLIRSKVAEFHPKDATRIRLVDFGRELED